MCIYYLDQANLNYFKREHIIPAGLGGREMLAQGIVSDEFNLSMAGLEKDYMNNSLYAGFARILLGPGQRGSLSPNKEVRSDVHVLVNKDDNSDVSLGYIQKGKTYELTQIRVNTLNNKLELQLAKDENINIENTIRQFKRDCQNIRDFSVTIIEANNIPINTFLFGILEFKNKKKAFFAKNAKEQINFSNILIENIGDKLYINIEDGMSTFSLPRSDQKIQLKPEYQRLHAKMAFNYLAFLYGCDYVSQSYFDPIRAWITYGGEDKFTKHMMNKDSAIQQIIKILPAYAHAILISESNNYIFGHVIIYGHWINLIVLCNNITSNRTNKLAGLICDWRQQKEFSLENLIKEHLIKEASNGTSNASFTT